MLRTFGTVSSLIHLRVHRSSSHSMKSSSLFAAKVTRFQTPAIGRSFAITPLVKKDARSYCLRKDPQTRSGKLCSAGFAGARRAACSLDKRSVATDALHQLETDVNWLEIEVQTRATHERSTSRGAMLPVIGPAQRQGVWPSASASPTPSSRLLTHTEIDSLWPDACRSKAFRWSRTLSGECFSSCTDRETSPSYLRACYKIHKPTP